MKLATAATLLTMCAVHADTTPKPLKVYILAGQSNMTGMVKASTFEHIKMDPETAKDFEALFDENGDPVVLDEVYVSCWPKGDNEAKGPLAPRFGAGAGIEDDSIGPEYAFGITMHKALDEPILIIKTAQGGRSLFYDFRPPSAGEWTPAPGHPDLDTEQARFPLPDTIDLPVDYVPSEEIVPKQHGSRFGNFLGIRMLRGVALGEVSGVYPICLTTVSEKVRAISPLEEGDLIIGVDGSGLGEHAVDQWKNAVSKAHEDVDDWDVSVTRWRKGKIDTFVLDLGKLLDGGRAGIPEVMAEWNRKAIEDKKNQGRSYRRMMDHVKNVLGDIKRVYPDYNEKAGYELAGFVWFQGWNDYVNSGTYPNRDKPRGYDQYTWLLAHFIRDVRNDLNAPGLPFVIGVMGVGGIEAPPNTKRGYFQQAMAAVADELEFEGSVAAVQTGKYWDHKLDALASKSNEITRKRKELQRKQDLDGEALEDAYRKLRAKHITPEEEIILDTAISNAAFHYLGSAKIMCGIGRGFSEAMLELQDHTRTTNSEVQKKKDQGNR